MLNSKMLNIGMILKKSRVMLNSRTDTKKKVEWMLNSRTDAKRLRMLNETRIK